MVYPIYLNLYYGANGGRELHHGIRRSIQYHTLHLDENKQPDDLRFDSIISELQEIMIDPHFEKTLDAFMKSNWASFGDNSNKQKEKEVFLAYKHEIENYLQNVVNFLSSASATKYQILLGSSFAVCCQRGATLLMSKSLTLFLASRKSKAFRAL